ncbi:MAG: hypothetical protein ACJ786_34065 [Catenulispora sp.]
MATTPSTGTDSAFEIISGGVQAALGEFRSITGSASSVVGSVETLVLDALSFAGIGAAVGSASESLHGQLVSGLGKVVSFVETLGGTVETVLRDYQQLDKDTADAFAALGMNGKPQTPGSTAASPTPAQTQTQTPPQTQATATQTAQTTHPAQNHPLIDDRVVNSIMASEGASGRQGHVDEVYGFRQSSHNGFDEIMAARAQYGQGSPQEHQVVADLLTRHAEQAGAGDFTDPGVRAAIASSAHMRGVGGTRAILNSMVTGDVHTSARSVSADNMAALQQLTPDQFQQQFRDARLNYDQTVYGNTITHQNGQTDTFWHRYGHGLTQRYDREERLFNTISHGASGGAQ